MKVGIIGPEKRKFTPVTAALARVAIMDQLADATEAVSGQWLGGGIDRLVSSLAARRFHIPYTGFPPAANEPITHRIWQTQSRALVSYCDRVVCITLASLPAGFTNRRGRDSGPVRRYCPTCKAYTHYACAGCWSVREAFRLGKLGSCVVVLPEEEPTT